MTCPNCGTENPTGKKFCTQCGTALALACASCGAPLAGDERFCGECGTPVAGRGPAQAPATAPEAPAAERRLVSVLFADLVGFTTLSESRDPEEVRDLLSRYFDTCRTLIGRYGGTVEKFIGDAVMAVWGTPVAREDDAERAVRAALDLVDAVEAMGQEVSAPDLKARAGVLTGEAAVTIGAEGQGMVAGDLVNTASRIQSAAQPGQVFVGDVTRRTTDAAIAYEDAGEHELKGKSEPVHLYRALRVVAGVGGSLKSEGLEAPFVGRDQELRLVKELFHASAEDRKAHLVSVIGIAGIGKSRLAWEFYKYFDGLSETYSWHRGRCPAYGEGVAYRALAEMVRMRARIVEGEEENSAREKLHTILGDRLPDPEERRWVEPRLGHLLGLEERSTWDRDDLFAAWRLFFERLSDRYPTIMVFEDTQWADASLLDFIEYLLEWSRDHPLFVVTLARPELSDRRPTWGAAKRNFTSLYLEPLAPRDMEDLLSGLVPGLPDEITGRILDRAEGVPLYAVETVRMLLDRGLLVQEGREYRPTGPIEALEVPETLQALIAARLDGLAPQERRLIQEGSVLGKTFTRGGLAALSGLPEDELDPLLASLVRKEILGVQADPRSPEHGQYGFLQDLVRKVAYDTLAKKDRKAKHLAVAAFIEDTWGAGDEEFVEILASHFLEAYRAVPEADDAAEIKARARDMLAGAGARAASLAATGEAQRYFEQAADLAEDAAQRAALVERAGEMAWTAGRVEEARAHLESALAMFDARGDAHPAARVSARLAEIDWISGRLEEAIERMEEAFRVLSADEPDEDLATLAAQLGRFHFFKGEMDLAADRVDFALGIAEALALPEVISQALNTSGIVALSRTRPEQALALLAHAMKVALDHDLPAAALRAHVNMADALCRRDRYEEALDLYQDGLALSRRVGNQVWERVLLSEVPYALFMAGRWDEAVERAAEIPESELGGADVLGILAALPSIFTAREAVEDAKRVLERFGSYETSTDVQEASVHATARAAVLLAEGRFDGALEEAEGAFRTALKMGTDVQMAKAALGQVADAAFSRGDLSPVRDLLATISGFRPAQVSPFVRAQAVRLQARLEAADGEVDAVEGRFKAAAGLFREIGVPFFLAQTLIEHGEWLVGRGQVSEAEGLLLEAGEIFERLKATVWLERLDRVRVPQPVGGGER